MMENEIKSMVLGFGADICGIAGMERFGDAPEGFRPCDIYASCKSVIVFGIPLPRGVFETGQKLIYSYFNYFICPELDKIALKTANALEKTYACTCVPLPSDGPYEAWDAETMTGHGILSMKHAAVAAGLGQLGKNTLLLNREYGNRLILGAVLTDLELGSDACAESICREKCSLCLRSCPVQALDGTGAIQKNCRKHAYGKNARGFDTVECNTCRSVCPMRMGAASRD